MELRLVGKHVDIVEDLLHRIRSFESDAPARAQVVILRGESGCGKSRIIRELYERLRSELLDGEGSSGPGYWPPLVTTEAADRAGMDPMAVRKLIAPSLNEGFHWPANALPAFAWWGINCERLCEGSSQDIVHLMRKQFDAHLLPLTLAHQRARSIGTGMKAITGQALDDIRTAFLEEGSDRAEDLLVTALEKADIVIPALGTLIGWGMKLGKRVESYRNDRRLLAGDIDLSESLRDQSQSAGRECAEIIAKVATRRLPAVLAIEDVHLMGPELFELLKHIRESPDLPILVVGSAWPEGATNDSFSAWLKLEEGDDAITTICDVPPLGESQLVAMLKELAPATDDVTARSCVQQLDNPLFLLLWLTSRKMKASLRRNGNRVLLSGEGSIQLPEKIEEVIRLRWREMDESVRSALELAVAARGLELVEDPTSSYIPEVVTEVAERTQQVSLSESLQAAVSPLAWCRRNGDVHHFAEPRLADFARSRAKQEYDEPDLADIRSVVQEFLAKWLVARDEDPDSLDTDEARFVASWMIQISNDDDERFAEALGWAHWVLAIAQSRLYDLRRAADHGLKAVRFLSAGDEGMSRLPELRLRVAKWLVDIDMAAEALHQLAAANPADAPSNHEFSPVDVDYVVTLMLAEAKAGDPHRAVEIGQSLLERAGSGIVLGIHEELFLRRIMASALIEAGRHQEAAEHLGEIYQSSNGLEPSPTSLQMRTGALVSIIRLAHKPSEAAEMMRPICNEYESHPDSWLSHVLWLRRSLASTLQQAGEFEAAIEERRGIVRLVEEHFAPDHTAIQDALLDWAELLLRRERWSEAVEPLRRAAEGWPEAGHWFGLGAAHFNAGEMQEAQRSFEMAESFLDQDDSQWLNVLEAHAAVLVKRSLVAEAISKYEFVLDEWMRIADDIHPNSFEEAITRFRYSAESLARLVSHQVLEEKEAHLSSLVEASTDPDQLARTLLEVFRKTMKGAN